MIELLEKAEILYRASLRCEAAGKLDMAIMWMNKSTELLKKCANRLYSL